MSHWSPAPRETASPNQDPADPRLANLLGNQSQSPQKSFVIQGFPDDEGIRLNGGRTGAALAPDLIRTFLYRMTPSWPLGQVQLLDQGNWASNSQQSLHEKQNSQREALLKTHQQALIPIGLGGGHDLAFPHIAAFLDFYLSKGLRPLVVNFDAHLDVRPLKNNSPHSGSPFFQLLDEFKSKFDFVELGYQDQCNSLAHRDWAQSQGAKLWNLQEALTLTPEILFPFKKMAPVFLSIDIDAFNSQLAPGCSAPSAQGLDLATFTKCIDHLLKNYKLGGAGIYEVSPPLDVQNLTSRLAALLVYEIIKRS